jgi:dipeptidase E
MGGGGFTMEPTAALDRFVLELTAKPVPRICFLPTASGDPREQAVRAVDPVAVPPRSRSARPA